MSHFPRLIAANSSSTQAQSLEFSSDVEVLDLGAAGLRVTQGSIQSLKQQMEKPAPIGK